MKVALWLFGVLVLVKAAIGAGTLFNGRNAATAADGIPLETFSPGAAQAFVSLFAAWGLAQLTLNAIALLVLLRYRALVPLMFTVLLLEHIARRVVFVVLPVPRSGTPPGFFINLALIVIMITGLALSLWERRSREEAGARV